MSLVLRMETRIFSALYPMAELEIEGSCTLRHLAILEYFGGLNGCDGGLEESLGEHFWRSHKSL